MSKWSLSSNNKRQTFNSFGNALTAFLRAISKHLWDYSYNNKKNDTTIVYDRTSVPDAVESFFCQKYDERTITDEEITIDARIGMLFDYLKSEDCLKIKENSLKVIKKEINYKGFLENPDRYLEICIYFWNGELIADIFYKEDKTMRLITNAFIIDDSSKEYYFKSLQVIKTSSNKDMLGKDIQIDLRLSKIED